jgi:VanZ family protein
MPRILLWGPVAAYMAVLFFLSSQPTLPGSSLTPDWTQHGVGFGGLALVTLRATSGGRWSGVTLRAVAAAWLITTAYGVADEWHQMFVPTRTADVRDVVADAVGAALALGGAFWWGMIRRSS